MGTRPQTADYRTEIDGLRALAIVPVVLFHAGYRAVPGGFLGVDIFFVISGYLITGLLLREIGEGRFSLAGFYARRARRILPALVLVVAVTLALAPAFLLPNEIEALGTSAAAAMGFVANHYFLGRVSYFTDQADVQPLLHLWSLSVEEQYYLLAPLILLLLWRVRPGRAGVLAAGTAVAAASLATTMWPTGTPDGSFYLLSSRAFELGIGSLLAAWLHGRPEAAPRSGGPLALLGLAAIAAALLFAPGTGAGPVCPALVACLGVALVILFATGTTLTARLLRSAPLVGIGLVSYGAYLWHQPLFAIARAAFLAPPQPVMAGLTLATFGLAWASWRFVERPVRQGRRPSGPVLLAAAAALAATAGLGLSVRQNAGLLRPLAPHDRQFDVTDAELRSYIEGEYRKLPLDFGLDRGRKLLLIGDSFSFDLYNMIIETGAFSGWQIAKHFIKSRCQLYLGPMDPEPHVAPAHRLACVEFRNVDGLKARVRRADVVMVAFNWRRWSASRADETMRELFEGSDAVPIVLGPKTFGDVNLRTVLGRTPEELRDMVNHPSAVKTASNALLAATVPPGVFVDFEEIACPKGACRMFPPAGEPPFRSTAFT